MPNHSDEPLLGEEEEPVNRGFFSSKTNLMAAIVAVLVIFAIIAGVAYYLLTDQSENGDQNEMPVALIDQQLMQNISIPNIAQRFHDLTNHSSLAGPGSLAIATYIKQAMIDAGVPKVTMYNYTVLLNYPNQDGSGRRLSHIFNHSIAWNASLIEPVIPVDPASHGLDAVPTFNAFSPSGNWEKSLFYGSYCTVDEFELLKQYKFNMSDKIVLCRYGDNFRGLKSMIGEKYGVAGVLIFSDPADDGAVLGGEYPDGPFRPSGAVQRGSATYLSLFSGDILSPGIARVEGQYTPLNFTQQNTPVVPGTPVHPISWADAAYLMLQLQGEPVNSDVFPALDSHGFSDWQGGMTVNGNRIPYHIGLLRGDVPVGNGTVYSETTIQLELEFTWKNVTIYDVIGEIPGSQYPEEHVILGNHHDAWVYGAVDPHQGTAVLLELARVYSTLYNDYNWRPARTLKLASWDAEEWGLMGSTEYVEQYLQDLQQNCVAYVNVDVAATGHTISLAATHSLAGIARNVTKQIQDPWKLAYQSLNHTLADTWAESDSTLRVDPLGSGSDFTPFLQFAGIPSISIEFSNATTTYGTYHSIYDSERYDATQIDGDHLGKVATARYWGVLGRQLVDAELVPFDMSEYAHEISDATHRVQDSTGAKALDLSKPFSDLDTSAATLITNAEQFMSFLNMINASALTVGEKKTLNMFIYQFEQNFLTPKDQFIFPMRDVDWYRHVIYAPSLFGGYSAVEFPGVVDAILGDVGINVNPNSTIPQRTADATTNINMATQLITVAAMQLATQAQWINNTIFNGTL